VTERKEADLIRKLMFPGYIIPKGWKVLVWFRSVHLDPKYWPEPMKFNPERWNVSWNSILFS